MAEDRGGRLTAQLGCGALLLVVVAAYIGAVAGSEGRRTGAESTAAPQAATLPPFFREGALVLMGTTETSGHTPIPVLRVLEVHGTWVRLRVDIDASVSRLAPYANASDEERQRMRESYARNAIPGEWWLNLAASSVSWSEYTSQ